MLPTHAPSVAGEAAFAATVPPPVIAANRSLLAALMATNILGQNTMAIAATEAQYAEMWAQDAAAMYGYAGSSAAASTLTPFSPPPPTTNPAGLAGQGAAPGQAVSAVPDALQELASPASAPSFLELLSSLTPVNTAVSSAGTAVTSTNLGYAAKYDPAGADKLDTILARLGAAPAGGTGRAEFVLSSSAGLGGSEPTVIAGLGRASSIGGLSVPASWAATAPAVRAVAATVPSAWSGALTAVAAGGPGSLFSQMALASLAGSGVGNAAMPGRAPWPNAEKCKGPNDYRRFAVETGDHIERTDFADSDHRGEQHLECIALTKLEREILALVRRYTAGS